MVIVDGFERDGTAGDWAGAEEGLGGGGRGYVNLTAGALHHISIEYRYDESHEPTSCHGDRPHNNVSFPCSSMRFTRPFVDQILPVQVYHARRLGNGFHMREIMLCLHAL